MTAGEKAVIVIRAQACEDALRFHVRHERDPYPGIPAGSFAYDADWHAQRLRSSCERALGTRNRPNTLAATV